MERDVLVRVLVQEIHKRFGRIELKSYVKGDFHNLSIICQVGTFYNNWTF